MSAAKQYSLLHEINSNNLANAETKGFKADNASFKAIYLNGGNAVSSLAYSELSNTHISTQAGPLISTGKSSDLALSGKGFFVLETDTGDTYFTKNISLMKSPEGVLVNIDGSKLITTEGKTVNVGTANYSIQPNGNIVDVANGSTQHYGSIKVVTLENSSIFKLPNGKISTDPETPPAELSTFDIHIGYQETSNVNSILAMGELVQIQKNYEMATKSLNTIKAIHKSSNSILE